MQYAKDNGYAIVSKDSDFQERSVLRGPPPKIIWLRATNCTSAEIEGLFAGGSPAHRSVQARTTLDVGAHAKVKRFEQQPDV